MKFKIGLVGCGNIFPVHAQSIAHTKGLTIQAVCDIKRSRARAAAKTYGCGYYLDYARMLEEERLDAVHILTPHYLHPPMAIQALNRKINVLTEKPISLDPKDAERMIAAARRNKVKLGVIFQNRYNPGSALVKAALSDGSLGTVRAAKLVLSYAKPDRYYSKSDWKGTIKKEGGGVLIDQAIHFVDLLLWLIGGAVDYVEAHTANRRHKVIEVEDLAEGVICFKKGTLVCFYLFNYYSYDADPEIEMDCSHGRVRIVKDSARVGLYNGKVREATPNPKDYIDYGGNHKDYWGFCHRVQIRDFYAALARKREPAVNGEEGLRTQRVVWAIYKSARTGKRVFLS